MRTRRFKKEAHKSYMGKLITLSLVTVLVAVLSIVGVMATSIPCTVIDGDEIYEFTMMTPETQAIIEKAVSEGMDPLDDDDLAVNEGGAVTVKRNITVVLENNDRFTALDAYTGDTVAEILVRNGIHIEDNDKLTPSADAVVSHDSTIILDTERTFYISADGSYKKVTTASCTVAAALEELGVDLGDKDKLNVDIDDNLTSGMEITVSRGNSVVVVDGDMSTEFITYSQTAEQALRSADIQVEYHDIVTPDRDAPVTDGMEITITRTEVKEVVEEEEIPFETEVIETERLAEGEEKIEIEGKAGLKKLSYDEIYVAGELYDKELMAEEVLAKPVTEVKLLGIRPKTMYEKAAEAQQPPKQSQAMVEASENTFTDMYGNEVVYESVVVGECTAYSIPGGICSTGVPAQVGVVAVNPNVIPYGTKMYITSGDVVYGYCVAGDTGGAALDNDIMVDLYYNTESECWSFGRRDMTIYFLAD